MSTTIEKSDALNRVIGYALHADRERHNLRRGLSPHSEHYAYELILPRLAPEHRELETVALRIAAIIADSNLPQGDQKFGTWLSRRVKSDDEGATVRLKQMMRQSAPEALLNVSRILKATENSRHEGFDWYDLGRTFTYWGNGMTERSLSTRQSILRDFYISKDLQSMGGTKTSDETEEIREEDAA